MTFDTILRLGRVSNLPTVWTNALAGAVLAGAATPGPIVAAAAILTLFYTGGMWLNDAFDAEIDARERANRPIPNGEISRGTVFAVGYVLLAIGIAAAFALNTRAGLAGIALAVTIILYDWLHKRTALSPIIMGATRFSAYALGATAVGGLSTGVLLGALGLALWIVGLTYAAKQEAYDRLGAAWPLGVLALPVAYALSGATLAIAVLVFAAGLVAVAAVALRLLFRRQKGDVPRAVITLIAGICLYDAALIAATGDLGLALIAASGFAVTLAAQKIAAGT